tara:strand:- start:3036 stop:3248 length:213 start_codon:yes stop_codon:yes gene_type:complete
MYEQLAEIVSKLPEFLAFTSLLMVIITTKRMERIEKRDDDKISELKSTIEKLNETVSSIKEMVIILKTKL